MATAYKKPDSPYWQVTWWEDSRQRKKSTKIKHNNLKRIPDAVKRIVSSIEERIALESFGVEQAWKSITVADALKEEAKALNLQSKLGKISEARSLALQGEYTRLKPMLAEAGIISLKDLNADTSALFLELGTKKWTNGTLKTRVGILSKLWQRHIDNGAPIKNFWKGQGIQAEHGKKRSLTQEELDILLSELPNVPLHLSKAEIQYLTMMGLFTGARIAMCQRLTESMVNLEDRVINFPKVKRKEHSSHIHPQLYQFLLDYPAREDGHYMDPNRNWSARYCYWISTRLRKNGLFEGFSHHCLRVTFNTLMLESGLPEQVTMEIIGHTSPEAHKRYKDIKASKYAGDIEAAFSGIKLG